MYLYQKWNYVATFMIKFTLKNKHHSVIPPTQIVCRWFYLLYSEPPTVLFHKNDNVVVSVGGTLQCVCGFTKGKGTSISSAFPLKMHCIFYTQFGGDWFKN